MMRRAMRRGAALAMFAAVAGLAGPATAQDDQQGNRHLRLDAVDTTAVPGGGKLVLYTSFLDRQGLPVAVPKDGPWVVRLDGEATDADRTVGLRRDGYPVHVVVVLGATATIESALPAAKTAITSLLGSLGPQDSSAVVGYQDVVQRTPALSPKHDDNDEFAKKLEADGITPPLYEAITRGLEFFPVEYDTIGPNRVMLVLTDGADANDQDPRQIRSQLQSLQTRSNDLNVRLTIVGIDIDGIGKFEGVRKLGSFSKASTGPEVNTRVDTFISELRGQYAIELAPDDLPAEKTVSFEVELESGGQTYTSKPVLRMTPEVPSNLLFYAAIAGGGLLGLIILIVLIRAIVRAIGNREPEGPVSDAALRPCRQCGNQIPDEWKMCKYCEGQHHFGRLTVAGGDGVDEWLTGQVFFIKDAQVSIGAADNNNVVLKVGGVSQRHAGIQVQDGRFELADFGSRNGTYINGARISKQFLKAGDELMFGPVKVEFKLKK